ncbi:TlpA family protein disulfide reductase [Mucilaginibacter sp.]|uniref:TlpA family protein disulfide reductase n=1 Tax=Mucilaginibacter sp. TaxID=1882438 RepID=UPI0035639655
MKKFLLLFITSIGFVVLSNAQSVVNRRETTTRARKIDERSIVKDSAGRVLPYSEWQKMLSSANYVLKTENPQDTNSTFKLVRLTTEQREGMLSRMTPPNESGFFTNGQKIETFKAWDIDNNKFDLKALEGKVVVLNFWFINCPPCRKEIPELNELVAKYASNPDVVFIAIALDDKADIKKFIKTSPYNYHLVPIGSKYADRYGVNLFPTNVVLDKTGAVKFNSSGLTMNTPYWIKKTIEESLAAN